MNNRIIERENWSLEFVNEWSQIWIKCNWYNITPIEISFENEVYVAQINFDFIILGLGFHFQFFKSWLKELPEGLQRLKKIAEELEKQIPEKEINNA